MPNKQEKIREGIRDALRQYRHLEQYRNPIDDNTDYLKVVTESLMNRLASQGAMIKVKCPDCEWSQFVGEESVGMTPCPSCNSTGYLIEPLVKEG